MEETPVPNPYDANEIRRRRRQKDWMRNAAETFVPPEVQAAIGADDKVALDAALKLHGVNDETRRNIIEYV